MNLSSFLDTLRAEGIDAKPHQVHHAIAAGYLPRPKVDSGRFQFRDSDLKAARRYLASPPRPGRKKQETSK